MFSLGAEAARLGLSVGKGTGESQCESVKLFSPKLYAAEVDTALKVADSNVQPIKRGCSGYIGGNRASWRACDGITCISGRTDRLREVRRFEVL